MRIILFCRYHTMWKRSNNSLHIGSIHACWDAVVMNEEGLLPEYTGCSPSFKGEDKYFLSFASPQVEGGPLLLDY